MLLKECIKRIKEIKADIASKEVEYNRLHEKLKYLREVEITLEKDLSQYAFFAHPILANLYK